MNKRHFTVMLCDNIEDRLHARHFAVSPVGGMDIGNSLAKIASPLAVKFFHKLAVQESIREG